MDYTLADLQQLEPFNEMQVIAGKDGLNNLVRYAGVLDAPDSVQFTREGEFVMTTGYILMNSEDSLLRTIEELHRKKAAALGIKMFRYLQSFPDSARQLADGYRLPIFFIPNKFSWHDLMMPLLLNICAANDISSYHLDTYDHLLNIIRRSQTIPEILSNTGALMNYPLTLLNEDASFVLSHPADYSFPLELSAATLARLHGSQTLALQNRKIYYYYQTQPVPVSLLIADLELKEYRYLILWDSPAPQNPTLFNSVIYSFVLTRDAIVSHKAKQKNLIHKENTLLNELFREEHPGQMVSKADLQDLQIDTSLRYSPAICQLFDDSGSLSTPCKLSIYDAALTRCFEYLRQHYRIYACVDENGTLHFLIPLNRLWQTQQDIVTYTRKYGIQIRKQLMESFPHKQVRILMGPVAETWSDLHRCHQEALEAYRLLDRDAGRSGVLHIHDIGATFLLSRPELTAYLEHFYEEYFSPLDELDQESRQHLLTALTTYIQCGFNFRETARVLDVHHNTVRNRLEHFSDLTGLTITQHEDLLIILICLQIRPQ